MIGVVDTSRLFIYFAKWPLFKYYDTIVKNCESNTLKGDW